MVVRRLTLLAVRLDRGAVDVKDDVLRVRGRRKLFDRRLQKELIQRVDDRSPDAAGIRLLQIFKLDAVILKRPRLKDFAGILERAEEAGERRVRADQRRHQDKRVLAQFVGVVEVRHAHDEHRLNQANVVDVRVLKPASGAREEAVEYCGDPVHDAGLRKIIQDPDGADASRNGLVPNCQRNRLTSDGERTGRIRHIAVLVDCLW